jgi:hypothetical protein
MLHALALNVRPGSSKRLSQHDHPTRLNEIGQVLLGRNASVLAQCGQVHRQFAGTASW